MKNLFIIFLVTLTTSWAYSANVGAGFKPTGIAGSVGIGAALFEVASPKTDFKLDQGVYAALGIEKGLNIWNFYVTFGLSYLTTEGQVKYHYETLSETDIYEASDVNMKMEIFQAALGLKFKIIDGYWIRPYVEGGGFGGYYTLKYDNLATKLAPTNTNRNFKSADSLIDFGSYAEGGMELSFSETFGIKAAARIISAETKKFETLNKQTLQYQSQVFYLSVLKAF